ncbi:MAG: peptidoglycan DD-metalloendopeptidase family protein [Chlorobi bacterium]|nr:peptidoglycan DD-metalloendopeptidase family protein [Chlorobiota bacterium]
MGKGRLKTVIWLMVATAGLVLGGVVHGQSSAELKKRREKLLREISRTKKQLERIRSSKKESLAELTTLKHQIKSREELISIVMQEIALLDSQITEQNELIQALSRDLERLKREYAELLRSAYRQYLSKSDLLFLLNAKSFNELFLRLRYMDYMALYRKEQAEAIRITQQVIEAETQNLYKQRLEKDSLLKVLEMQKYQYEKEMQEKERLIERLKRKEQQLREELRRKQAAEKKLRKAIEEAIRREMERKRAAATGGAFASMRGKLPWPVKGIIVGKYGTHRHPVLKNVTVKNNGIDIQTNAGEEVKAVFDGEVVNVLFSPMFKKAVLIKHGKDYYTVYSNLDVVYVKSGDKVKQGTVIGKVSSDGSVGKLHFEIWKGTKTQNPEQWLRR